MIDSIYIHIPFCREICTYCDFCKMLYLGKLSKNYFTALEKEFSDRYMKEQIKTLYIGGGTPSVLNDNDLEKLLNIIGSINLSENYEFTFECNIYDINEKLLLKLKQMGVNRLSIGIESFDKDNLSLMGRSGNFFDAKKKIELARSLGFTNINLDIIYALPHESLNTLKNDIKLLLKLKPEHISTYSLILEDNTLLKLKGYKSINEDLDSKMYNYIIKKLKKSGYNHYELSNFSKKEYESQHNLNCWNNEEYYGFGLGAAGYFAGVRYQNTRNLNDYLKGKTISDKEIVSKDSMMKYELMLGFRKINGINILDFQNKYNVSIFEAFKIKDLIKDKSLILKNNQLYINPKKLYLMNEILLKII